MSRPKLLDLFCCEGGAGEGCRRAGFDVYGVDIVAQPRYPFPFRLGDALAVIRRMLRGASVSFAHRDGTVEWLTLAHFAAVHASPPCQARTRAQKIRGNEHPNLIAPTRELLAETGLPWVIENFVADSPEADPDPIREDLILCGATFGIQTYRHRVFELAGFAVQQPYHPPHAYPTAKMGRPAKPWEHMHIVGNFSGVDRARQIMEMPWASRDGLREAIPPAYTEFIGAQLITHLELAA